MSEDKKKVEVNISWLTPWIAGWLFTLGRLLSHHPKSFSNLSGWELAPFLLVLLIGWPLILGLDS